MGRQKSGARVLGPYGEDRGGRTRFRVVVVDQDGQRTTFIKQTEQEAKKLVKAAWRALNVDHGSVVTVTDVVERFISHKIRKGFWSERTVSRTGKDLRVFAEVIPEAPIEVVNVAWVRSYLENNSGYSLAYQRSRYHALAEFLGWCRRRGYLKVDPCEQIDRSEKAWVGKRARRQLGRGKPQLGNVGEVREFLGGCRELPTAERRVAAALPLLAGLRNGEVRHLQVRDVDFGAGKLWIRDVDDDENVVDISWSVKTAAGRRTVGIPEELDGDLRFLCEGRAPEAFVFESTRKPGCPWGEKWLVRMVNGVCSEAGTRVVTPQGLRDTYSSLRAELDGLDARDIGKLLGHSDDGATARGHYIGVPEHGAVLRVVPGTGTPSPLTPLPQAGEGDREQATRGADAPPGGHGDPPLRHPSPGDQRGNEMINIVPRAV